MAARLGAMQLEVLRFIRRYQRQYDDSPSVREICEATGLGSTNTGMYHLKALETKGYIRRRGNVARSIEIILWDWLLPQDRAPQVSQNLWLPVVGEIAAGLPIDAYEDREDYREVPRWMAGSAEDYFLKVRGDSMIDEHICPGDLVLIHPQDVARNGDIVVALLGDNGATLKTFFHEGHQIRLQPANPTMPAIIIPRGEDCRIQGIVRAVIRQAA